MKLSTYTVIVLIAAIVLVFPWSGNWHAITWDIFGYYLYLPEFFIWHDPGITNYSFIQGLVEKYQVSSTFYQVHPNANGNYLIQYPIGMALMFVPAFLIAHGIAFVTGAPLDGLSAPYEWAIVIEHFTVMAIGLWLSRKVFLHFFSDRLTAFLLIMLVLGTNYFHQAFYSVPSTHIYLFTLHAAFILITFKWFEKPGLKLSFFYGALLALITLIRVTDALIVLVPVLFKINRINDVKARLKEIFFGKRFIPVLVASMAFTLGVLPQLVFWKIYSGEWFYYSYKNAGEGFEFLQPYTLNFLFSFRKGWFVYTPFMLLLIPGLYYLFKLKNEFRWMIFTFLVLDIYILSSWSCWWYAGGFSQRPLIQAYTLFLMPIGFFVQHLIDTSKFKTVVLMFYSSLVLVLNQFQIWQAYKWIIHPSRMTAEAYFKAFGAMDVPKGMDTCLLVTRTEIPGEMVFKDSSKYHIHYSYKTDFEDPDSYFTEHINNEIGFNSHHSLHLSEQTVYSNNIHIPFNELSGNHDHAWIRVKFKYCTTDSIRDVAPTLVYLFKNQKGEEYDYNGLRLEEHESAKQIGTWKYFETTFLAPEVRNAKDPFILYFWIRGKGAFFVDDIEVQSFVKNY